MFDNIGEKIKGLAVVLCILGMIASVILGLTILSASFWLALLTIAAGCVGSWIGSFCLYGFGELIEETSANRQINAEILKCLKGEGDAETSKIADAFKRASSVGSYTIPGAKAASADSWRCKKCNSINHRTQQYCANCGEYK